MQTIISILRVSYPEIHVPQWEGRRLRGFFASGQEAGSPLHNHDRQSRDLYRYPLVQYKVVDGVPVILAIENGIPALQQVILNCRELTLGGQVYPCGGLRMELEDCVLGDTRERCRYKFRSPWFGLNQRNYRQYEQSSAEDQKSLLERVLAGNLLSLSKEFGVYVEQRLEPECALRSSSFRFKNETVLGFEGEFSVNFLLPDLLGLGKSVSKGFGTVSALPKEPEAQHPR